MNWARPPRSRSSRHAPRSPPPGPTSSASGARSPATATRWTCWPARRWTPRCCPPPTPASMRSPASPRCPRGWADVLLRRPDVIAAEHRLLAASANIGAARAAFFPSISLTGSVGSASDELSGLFDSGTRVWSFIPRLNLPIFQGGRLRAGLGMATADRDIALAEYERAIQAGFREVADALVSSESLAAQVRAQQDLVDAATRAEALARARYDAGVDSHLVRLDAQRTLYAAQQALVATRLAEQANRVTLYRALGGGWRKDSARQVAQAAGGE